MSKLCLFCGKDINDENLWHRSCIKKMFNSSTIPHIDHLPTSPTKAGRELYILL